MSYAQMSELKKLFSAGHLLSAYIDREGTGYTVLVTDTKLNSYHYASQREKSTAHIFKSADGAIKALEEIGFTEMTVSLKRENS